MSSFERALVGITTWLMALSGALYFVMKYLMIGSDPFSAFHHPWQPHVLAAHVLLAPLAVFGLGLIARGHVLDRLQDPRQRRGRASGIQILALATPLVVSGYLLQVMADPGVKRVLVGVHVVGGVLYTLLYGAHLVVSRPARRGKNGNGGRRVPPRTVRGRLDRPARGV